MAKTDGERLTRIEDNQTDSKETMDRIFKRLDAQDKVLASLTKKFDEMTGAKKVLMGVYGLIALVSTLLATYFGIHHK